MTCNHITGRNHSYTCLRYQRMYHDDVIIWKYSPRYWLFMRGIHRSPVDSPHKRQWREASMFSRGNVWANNLDAGDLTRHRKPCFGPVNEVSSTKPWIWPERDTVVDGRSAVVDYESSEVHSLTILASCARQCACRMTTIWSLLVSYTL